jgi:predicted GTPase
MKMKWQPYEIKVAFLGRVGAAKSTLINVILQDQYAVSSRNKTHATALL